MAATRARKQCDRCGARPAAGKLFLIPWTGDRLCKACIDRDSSLQRMFAEIESISHDSRSRKSGTPAGLPDGADMTAFLLEPDDN